MTTQNIPITAADFKDYFDRDFPYSVSESDLTKIRNKDINKAIGEAGMLYNPDMFIDEDDKKIGFLYLTAHYLVIDISNASTGINGKFSGYLTSKSVGSVSSGYNLPQWILESPLYSGLGQTVYGMKYLSLMAVNAIGNVGIAAGASLP